MNSKVKKNDSESAPILKAENIAMGYGNRLLLRGVGLAIMAGECVVLKGSNGSGKTTLVRGLAGLIPLMSGTVRINGRNSRNDRVAANRGIVHLGHLDALAAELTAREALALWAGSRGLSPTGLDLNAALEALDLAAMADSPVRALSAGQKRRAAMLRLVLMTAMGQTGSTPLWLLDEPTSTLDGDSVARFAKLVEDHLASGGAALVTSHHGVPIRKAREVSIVELSKSGDGSG